MSAVDKTCAEVTRTTGRKRKREARRGKSGCRRRRCNKTVRVGKSSYSFMSKQKKGGSEVERTGTLLAGPQHKHWCASAGLRPPAGASACSGHKDKDALMRAKSAASHLAPGVQSPGPRKHRTEGRINTGCLAKTELT